MSQLRTIFWLADLYLLLVKAEITVITQKRYTLHSQTYNATWTLKCFYTEPVSPSSIGCNSRDIPCIHIHNYNATWTFKVSTKNSCLTFKHDTNYWSYSQYISQTYFWSSFQSQDRRIGNSVTLSHQNHKETEIIAGLADVAVWKLILPRSDFLHRGAIFKGNTTDNKKWFFFYIKLHYKQNDPGH